MYLPLRGDGLKFIWVCP